MPAGDAGPTTHVQDPEARCVLELRPHPPPEKLMCCLLSILHNPPRGPKNHSIITHINISAVKRLDGNIK